MGSELLQFIINKYSKYICCNIFVKTYAADTHTIFFYGRNGFFPISIIPELNGNNDEGTIVMRKKIRNPTTSST